jgi:transcriptional regulator with XRE-family HTH domain
VRPSAPQIRAARAWLGWSRSQAAYASGIKECTIARVERGDQAVSTHSIRSIVAAYRVRGIEFLGADAIHRNSGVQF